jgi:hypothetical protein
MKKVVVLAVLCVSSLVGFQGAEAKEIHKQPVKYEKHQHVKKFDNHNKKEFKHFDKKANKDFKKFDKKHHKFDKKTHKVGYHKYPSTFHNNKRYYKYGHEVGHSNFHKHNSFNKHHRHNHNVRYYR